MIYSVQDFVSEYSTDAIPVAAKNGDLVMVLGKMVYNDAPGICLSTAVGEVPEMADQVQIAEGEGLDPDDDGWACVMRGVVSNLRLMADSLEAWAAGKKPQEFWAEFGLEDDDE